MSIEAGAGDLLAAPVEALVNAVNTVGVMGKGLALQFKQAFPENFAVYKKACTAKTVQPGTMLVVPTGADQPKWIINFPTKRHWKAGSRLEDIESGLSDLVRVVRELKVQSIAIPALGCGLGGLEWSVVQPRIVAAFEPVQTRVLLFAPGW